MTSILDGLASVFVAVLGDDELAHYTRADSSWSGDVKVIFEDPTIIDDLGANGRAGAIVRDTTFHVDESQLAGGYDQGDTIVFRSTTWTVRAALPNGRGMVVFQVEKAA